MFVFVAVSMIIVIPMTAPTAKSQPVIHLGSTFEEDNNSSYDVDMTPGIVKWTDAEDHIMNIDYIVNSGYELVIPALNYYNNPALQHEISVQQPINITVQPEGKLTIMTDGLMSPTKTAFLFSGFGMWNGIFFEPGSEGVIQDVIIQSASQGVVFSPGSVVGGSGITNAQFLNYGQYGVRMDGAVGNTIIHTSVDFTDSNNVGTGVYVSNGDLVIRDTNFLSHGPNQPSLRIKNATVSVETCWFGAQDQDGYSILVEDSPAPNSTVVSDGIFDNGAADNYYIRSDGASPFIDNCSFDNTNDAQTIIANDNVTGFPSHPILRNPNEGELFDNTTINATDSSTVTLQWYLDVYVDDPDGNPISGSQVNVSAPSQPATKQTDGAGWAEWFMVTGLIRHSDFEENFSPFNVSAENFTMLGYAEPIMNQSKDVFITVPFNPIPNTLPMVINISTPVGVQTGPVSIDFVIEDPDPGDEGDIWIQVFFWDPIEADLITATQYFTSDPKTGLSSGVQYTFVWDSRNIKDFQNKFSTEVSIKIIAFDSSGFNGTPNQTGDFTVDNEWPVVLTGPTPDPQDTTCTIIWTVNEPANATVEYGLYGDGTINDLTDEKANLTISTQQSIILTGLIPGRRYTYIITSTDELGNTYSSIPTTFSFDTYVYIYLYSGWNMISVPPWLWDETMGPLWEDNLQNVLSSIAGDWDMAQWYDPRDPADPWKTNHTARPYHMNDLHTYNCSWGLWLHMTAGTVLVPNYFFDEFYPTHENPIYLHKGWNFVGYPSLTNRNIATALSSISGHYDKVEHYDAASGQLQTYDGPGGETDTLFSMEMGRGYWIHCTNDVQWTIGYV
ncbi:MAG: right-handed parallel beta-helix repeat-containing protein [Thermoplasmata archaeon]|nr:MAG: right-handed parallel beta-helix repeat-containing protein [Thermoplasmata archaeon]